jgi:uncharacterized protein (DUF1501 family)
MDTLSRRNFLKLSGAAAVAAAAPMLTLEQIAQAATMRPLPLGTPILIVITLYGGNDGLNTVVPYKDPIYYQARPDISFSQSELLPLDSELGLNGSMAGIKSLWDQNKVAICRGVGYPDPDLSHFTSMAIWQSASPDHHVNSGWVGRWLDTQTRDPMLAISLGSVLLLCLPAGVLRVQHFPWGELLFQPGRWPWTVREFRP